jgi:hypothetical protein
MERPTASYVIFQQRRNQIDGSKSRRDFVGTRTDKLNRKILAVRSPRRDSRYDILCSRFS